jgi:prophage tail gpP-like protein
MQTAYATVLVGGQRFLGWEDITIMASAKEACRSFSLTVAAEMGGAAAAALFQLFTPIRIMESGELIFTGYVDHRAPRLGKTHAEIMISGRSKGQDAVDCSCIHKTGRFEKKTPLEIAQELDQFGIGFSSDTELDKIPEYQLKPGATLFREIERLARDQGVTLSGQPDGSIKLTKAGENAKRQAGLLQEGVNFEEVTGDFHAGNRHSKVHVRGQSYDGHGKDALQIDGLAEDSSVPRYRPLVLVQDANTDKKRAKKRAQNRRDKAAGEGIRATGQVPGWRDEAGTLWTPGNIVWTSSPFLALEQDMLIETVTYRQSAKGHGSVTNVHLVDPRAHGGKASKAGQSGAAWAGDFSNGNVA